ncbi:PadR family transcriptional regulator, partial [Streptomyces sp. AC1-42T]
SVEREVRWLNELIESERSGRDQRRSSPESSAQQNTAGEPDGLPRRGDNPSDPSGDTAK